MTQEIRWHYRFENFSRALDSLKTPLESGAPLNDLELSGIIVAFNALMNWRGKYLETA